jgi:sarcosine oxidase subunit alpha
VTTTSTGADAVCEWFEWWNAVWRLDVDVVNVTGALAALNLAGPRAREALATLTEADVSNEALRYLDARRLDVADVTCLALRIGFVGELGYELHCASPAAEHVWDALVGAGARPFGLEPQRILRLEKQHVIVGQDTDSESNLHGAGLGWLPKLDKDDFVGKWALEHAEVRERLVGFVADALPLEGAQVVHHGRSIGRVTSARRSELLGSVVGLAWVPPELAVEDAEIHVQVDGEPRRGRVRLQPFHDPAGERVRA